MSKNPITGDSIATRFGSAEQQKAFEMNFERIFGKPTDPKGKRQDDDKAKPSDEAKDSS